jgi:hypothetical protein
MGPKSESRNVPKESSAQTVVQQCRVVSTGTSSADFDGNASQRMYEPRLRDERVYDECKVRLTGMRNAPLYDRLRIGKRNSAKEKI